MNNQAIVLKDNQIQELRMQINELRDSVKTLKDQSDERVKGEMVVLQKEVDDYKSRLNLIQKEHSSTLNHLKSQHISDLQALKDSQFSEIQNFKSQLGSLNGLLSEKDALLDSVVHTHQNALSDKENTIKALQGEILRVREDHRRKENEI